MHETKISLDEIPLEQIEEMATAPADSEQRRAGFETVSLLYEQAHNYVRHYDQRVLTVNTLFVTIAVGAISLFLNDVMDLEKAFYYQQAEVSDAFVRGKDGVPYYKFTSGPPIFLIWVSMCLSFLAIEITRSTARMRKEYARIAARIEEALEHFVPKRGEETAIELISKYYRYLSNTVEHIRGPQFVRSFLILHIAIITFGVFVTLFPESFGMPDQLGLRKIIQIILSASSQS